MAKNSKEYWQERMLLEEESVRKNANQYLKMLQTEYKAGIKALDDELKQFYEVYATENNVSAARIRKPMNREEWKRYEAYITELLKVNGCIKAGKQETNTYPEESADCRHCRTRQSLNWRNWAEVMSYL